MMVAIQGPLNKVCLIRPEPTLMGAKNLLFEFEAKMDVRALDSR